MTRNAAQRIGVGVLALSCGWSSIRAAEPVVAFGLTNTPIGSASVALNGSTLVVTRNAVAGVPGIGNHTGLPPGNIEGGYGVSVNLGGADAGVFVSPHAYPENGAFMVGKAIGEVDGVDNRLISLVGAAKRDYGNYIAWVDFGGIGTFTADYELYDGSRLVAASTDQAGVIQIYTDTEYGPRANPCWRLANGSIAVRIDLSYPRPIWVPGATNDYDFGDRIIIRPHAPAAEVVRAARVEVTAGGSLAEFSITDERLGAFGHAHKALGGAVMKATPTGLSLVNTSSISGDEFGVLIELQEVRSFSAEVAPLDLSSNGASVMASAVGDYNHRDTEFLGFAGVRNVAGARQVFADLTLFEQGVAVAVFLDHCEAGAVLSPTIAPTVGLSGAPRVIGWDAFGDLGSRRPALGIRFDRVTTFTLPDGSMLQGNEIRFKSVAPALVERLTAFSLLSSNLGVLTLTGESGGESLTVADYWAELVSAAAVKRFNGVFEGTPLTFAQTVSRNASGAAEYLEVDDTLPPALKRSETFALLNDNLIYHGYRSASLQLFSSDGLQLLPARPGLGQTYQAVGAFRWRNTNSGLESAVQVTAATRVAGLDTVDTGTETFAALRIETTLDFGASTEPNAPLSQHRTNWQAYGIGVVAFGESEQFAGAPEVHRAGTLTSYNLLTSSLLHPVVNVGANPLFSVSVANGASPVQLQWQRDGGDIEGATNEQFLVYSAQFADAGTYSVRSSNDAGVITAAVAKLTVQTFSEAPEMLAWSGTGPGWIRQQFIATDDAGNLYLAGTVRGGLAFRTNLFPGSVSADTLFVVKFDSSGNVLWSRTGGVGDNDSLSSLGVDGAGNVYLMGSIYVPASFGPFTLMAPADQSMFVAKLSPTGNWLWAVQPDSPNQTIGLKMAVDATGNSFIAGNFVGSAMFGTNTLDEETKPALFLTRLDSSGHFIWARSLRSGGNYYFSSSVNDLVTDGVGGFYVSGYFQQSLEIGGMTLTSGSLIDSGFIGRFTGSGDLQWAQLAPLNVDMDRGPSGDIYLHGSFYYTIQLGGFSLSSRRGPGWADSYLARMHADGSVAWARAADAVNGYQQQPMLVDGYENIYLAGSFYGETTASETTFVSPDVFSTLLSKFDSSGRRLWSKQLTGGGENIPWSMARDTNGNVFLNGEFDSALRLDTTILSGSGTYNPFIVKMRSATPPAFTQQPQPQTVNVGASVTFTVMASGTAPLKFQWRRNGIDLPNATQASLTLAAAQASDAGSYSVVVANQGGLDTSLSAALEVLVPDAGTVSFGAPTYAVSEQAAVATIVVVRAGDTSRVATVSMETAAVSATAGTDYSTTVGMLSFAPGETLRTVDVPILHDNSYEPTETVLLRLCRPGPGVSLGAPQTALLSIIDDDPTAPVILSQPRQRTVGEGGGVTFSVMANGAPPLAYQWRKNGANIAGANAATFTLLSASMIDAGDYSVRVSNSSGEAVSSNAVLTVQRLPVILVQPQDQSVPYGDPASFHVVATSSIPVVTQLLARAGSGPLVDRLRIANTISRGTLSVRCDFGDESDSLRIFLAGALVFDTGYVTGHVDLEFFYDYSYPPPLELVINEDGLGGGDGWSYEGGIISQPLRYTWRKDGWEIPFLSTSELALPGTSMMLTGAYSVVVSDVSGSVISQSATLSLNPPVLRIQAWTNGGPAIRLFWTTPDHFPEFKDDVEGASWESLPSDWGEAIVPATNSQQFYRLRMRMGGGHD